VSGAGCSHARDPRRQSAVVQRLAGLPRPDRLGLLFGSEGHGLDAASLAACDRRVMIPMQPGVDSLNVAAATAIFLYELASRRASTA